MYIKEFVFFFQCVRQFLWMDSFGKSISNHICPQGIIDLGLTCGCPINPVHLVKNYHPRGSNSSSLKPLSIFELLLHEIQGIWFGYDTGLIGLLNLFSGNLEVNVVPSAYASLVANVCIFENISILIQCISGVYISFAI